MGDGLEFMACMECCLILHGFLFTPIGTCIYMYPTSSFHLYERKKYVSHVCSGDLEQKLVLDVQL